MCGICHTIFFILSITSLQSTKGMQLETMCMLTKRHSPLLSAMPDFTEVYSFLGGVFDPSTDGHLEKMQEMAPIDRETVSIIS
jgi:hypothetical protein